MSGKYFLISPTSSLGVKLMAWILYVLWGQIEYKFYRGLILASWLDVSKSARTISTVAPLIKDTYLSRMKEHFPGSQMLTIL